MFSSYVIKALEPFNHESAGVDALVSSISLGLEIFACFFFLQLHVQLNFNSNSAPIVWLHVLNQKNERDWFKLRGPHGIISLLQCVVYVLIK